MGRYYDGNISGKFWFGIQNSDDASYFGVEYKDVHYYHLCLCGIDEEPIENNVYCSNCYSSYEEHKESIVKECINEEIDEYDKTWYKSENEIYYCFNIETINNVKEKVSELENKYGKYILEYTILESNNTINYDCKIQDDLKKDILEWIARLCLGRQILYCLNKNSFCSFYAEL